jgi:hypothetical protein
VNLATARPVGTFCGVVYKGRPPCRQRAGFGTDHVGSGPCRYHGGLIPAVTEHHQESLAEWRANRALQTFGVPLRGADPEQVLLDLVAEAAGNVAWLGNQVMELAEKPVDDDKSLALWSRSTSGGDYSKGKHLFGPKIDVDKDGTEHVVGEEERAMVKLYGQWSDRLAKYAKAAIDAGIERRRVEMAERHGEQIVVVVNNVLIQLGISGDQLALARTMIATEFRRIATVGDIDK